MNECLIGVDLSANYVRVALVKDNEVKDHLMEEVHDRKNKDTLINQIASLIDRLLTSEVSGIGLGVPSVVDTKKGIVYNVQNIQSWEEVHLKSIYQNRFNLPVHINNDANCFALGEKYFGKGKNCDSLVGAIIDSGLGAGLFIEGKLYEGPNCGAGEVGMLPYRESIIEHYCSEIFFKRRENLDSKEVLELAKNGNPEVKTLLDEFGVHLGIALEAIIYAYDPEMIVLGGSLSKGFKFFKDAMYSSLQSFAYQRSLRDLEIKISNDDFMAVKGAAALVLENKKSL
ncbi:MAG TPA: ROK family protein [Balneolaceae bacterium]|nr:ROK family protein [Balneolaceae bacterium]